MLTIAPTQNYNTSFKANQDLSKIYKEMEKITLHSEEKIVPKRTKFSHRSFFRLDGIQNRLKNLLPKKQRKQPRIMPTQPKRAEILGLDVQEPFNQFLFALAGIAFAIGASFMAFVGAQIYKYHKEQKANTELVKGVNKDTEFASPATPNVK